MIMFLALDMIMFALLFRCSEVSENLYESCLVHQHDDDYCDLNRLQHSINVIFICTGKPKNGVTHYIVTLNLLLWFGAKHNFSELRLYFCCEPHNFFPLGLIRSSFVVP